MVRKESYYCTDKPKCQNLFVLNSSVLTFESIVGFNSTPSICVSNAVPFILSVML